MEGTSLNITDDLIKKLKEIIPAAFTEDKINVEQLRQLIGAIKVKGTKMTAVLAHGLHNIYPKENEELGNNILINNGLLISEYFVNEKANKGTFVERDRLQAGISLGTIVIQTGITGGTMYTVNETVKSKKMLAAVHFQKKFDSIHEKNQGNIKIIKEGAFALTSTNFKEFVNLLNNSSLIYKI